MPVYWIGDYVRETAAAKKRREQEKQRPIKSWAKLQAQYAAKRAPKGA